MNSNETPPASALIASASGADVERELRRRSRRSFLTMALAAGIGVEGLVWLMTRPKEDYLPWPVRRMLRFNERVSGKIFDPKRLIREMPASAIAAGGPRVNGDYGLAPAFDPASWRLRIAGSSLALTLEEIKTLPAVAQITPLHCIEGWTTVARWTGARFSDFVDRFHPEGRRKPFVGMATPDEGYYVGLDSASAMHPQTLLCYAINGAPISNEHGAPLRLLIPTKYGVKNLKRVGTIRFADRRPRDFWAEQGYDWFAGL